MINYTEKGHRLHKIINAAGHLLSEVDGVWESSDNTAVQAIIDSYDPLPEAKTDAKARIIKEASKRVSAIYPFINPDKEEAIGLYEFTTDLYLSTKANAREPLTGRLLQFKMIHDTAQAAITVVNSMTDWQVVDAYDAATAPGW